MNRHQQKLAAARSRAATAAQQPPVAPVQPQSQPQPEMDQSAIKMVSKGAEARIVPNPPGVGESSVRDYDPNRHRSQAVSPYSSSVRAHQPEGSAHIRSPGSQAGAFQAPPPSSHIRDPNDVTMNRPGERNVRPSGATVQDARRPQFTPAQGQQQHVSPQYQVPPGMVAPGRPQQAQPGLQPSLARESVPQPLAQQVAQTLQKNDPGAMPGSNPGAAPVAPSVPMAVGPTESNPNVADLTVVLTTFRRPQFLRTQLQHLADQTLRIRDLWIWSNDVAQGASMHDHEAETAYTFFHSRVNIGPWVRFSLATEVQTKYVLILDDDCFPGSRWIESAIQRLEELESQGETAVICAEGRIFGSDDPNHFTNLGPSGELPTEESFIDEGTKAWLIPRALIELINALPRAPSPIGWGLHVAAALQQVGVFQMVLAYPSEESSLWGSLPLPADAVTVSLSQAMPQFETARAAAWSFYRAPHPEGGGWIPMQLMPDPSEAEASEASQTEPSHDAQGWDAFKNKINPATAAAVASAIGATVPE